MCFLWLVSVSICFGSCVSICVCLCPSTHVRKFCGVSILQSKIVRSRRRYFHVALMTSIGTWLGLLPRVTLPSYRPSGHFPGILGRGEHTVCRVGLVSFKCLFPISASVICLIPVCSCIEFRFPLQKIGLFRFPPNWDPPPPLSRITSRSPDLRWLVLGWSYRFAPVRSSGVFLRSHS